LSGHSDNVLGKYRAGGVGTTIHGPGAEKTGAAICTIRADLESVIPYKSIAINRPAFFPKALYKALARIEQAVG
jgi:hypothetical protein